MAFHSKQWLQPQGNGALEGGEGLGENLAGLPPTASFEKARAWGLLKRGQGRAWEASLSTGVEEGSEEARLNGVDSWGQKSKTRPGHAGPYIPI